MLSSVPLVISFIFFFFLTDVVDANLFASNAQDSSLVSISQCFFQVYQVYPH